MATVLLLDMSGSMLESDPPVLASLKDSAKAFLDKVVGEQGQEVAIYYFDGQAQIHKLDRIQQRHRTRSKARSIV